MSFLLDTNVVSEWAKPRPDPGVVTWLAEADEDRLFLSVATLAEIRHRCREHVMHPKSEADEADRNE